MHTRVLLEVVFTFCIEMVSGCLSSECKYSTKCYPLGMTLRSLSFTVHFTVFHCPMVPASKFHVLLQVYQASQGALRSCEFVGIYATPEEAIAANPDKDVAIRCRCELRGRGTEM